jgi:hypothetical protein
MNGPATPEEGETLATEDEARQAIIDNVAKRAPNASPSYLLLLAEAYAWAVSPGQPHGSGPKLEMRQATASARWRGFSALLRPDSPTNP